MPNQQRFTERETEEYYDAEDALYRSFWDSAGSLHWGIFDGSLSLDDGDVKATFLRACSRLNEGDAGLTPGSTATQGCWTWDAGMGTPQRG